MEIMLLKASGEDNFEQMPSFFSSDLNKFKLETHLKILLHIVDEKQAGIKDAIRIISSLSEVLKLVKLILTLPATNATSERSCSMLCRIKTYLRSSMTQERLGSCLILATYKEKIDKPKLVEVANQFCFENEHHFSI